ncbi:hypothetical protein [Ensifer aridi]|uniref:hypothetical protein n=1 Tax=Ensifer aridi TaxID=1708715 RepID=UPI0015E2BDA2|nr:hypothetical protein [Ensifer aridi]
MGTSMSCGPKLDQLQMPTAQTQTRMIVGWLAVIGIAGLFSWLAYSETGDGPMPVNAAT